MSAARELDVYGLVEGETVDLNLAHGTVTASGTGTVNPPGFNVPTNPTYTNDGDDQSTVSVKGVFSAVAGTYLSIWQSDLGTASAVSSYVVREAEGYEFPPLYPATEPDGKESTHIYWSDNGSDWTDFSTSATESTAVVNGRDEHTYTFAAPLTHRYWRLVIVAVFAVTTSSQNWATATWRINGAAPSELTLLGTLFTAFDVRYRDELDGHGSVQFSIPRYSDPEAGTANPEASIAMLGDGVDVTRLIKVRLTDGAGGWKIVGAGWLETGDFTLLTDQERGAETLTFAGRGSLAYLDRGQMADLSYLTSPFIGEHPFDRKWRLWAAGTGPEPIAILWRITSELQEAARPSQPVPLMTRDFTYDLDSTSAAVTVTAATDEFEAQVGERVLAVVGRLLGTGEMIVRMSHALVLSAYNVANFGTDRTGLAFGAGVVRFEDGVNIRALSRQIASGRRATHSVVQGDGDVYGHAEVADAADRPHWESFVAAAGTDTTALDAIGAADLAQRVQRSEVVRFPFQAGITPLTGYYLPWTDVSPGDEVTIHTGDQERDLDDVDGVVAALTMADKAGAVPLDLGDLDFWIEVGSTMSVRDAAGSSIVSGYSSGGLVTNVGGGSPGGPAPQHRLGSHTDVEADSPVDGDVIAWSDYLQAWVTTAQSGDVTETPVDHGAMGATETLDFSAGTWHRGTLDADVTLTVTGYTVDEGVVALVKFTQDGTGGWGITWDPDVVLTDDGQPGQDPGDVTWFLLWSDEGDSVVYEAKVGGGSAITVEDEGTPLATAATTLDFVGAGVTASGAGAEKTITIPGVTAAAVMDAGRWEVVVSGTAPPVAVSNPDDDDWVYGWVSG